MSVVTHDGREGDDDSQEPGRSFISDLVWSVGLLILVFAGILVAGGEWW